MTLGNDNACSCSTLHALLKACDVMLSAAVAEQNDGIQYLICAKSIESIEIITVKTFRQFITKCPSRV